MPAAPRVSIRRSVLDPSADLVEVDLAMPSDVAEVANAVELMARHCFEGAPPSDRTAFRLRVTLAEALSNAILRGNLEDPGKSVWVRAEVSQTMIRLSVRDEGSGCEPGRRARPCLPTDVEDDGGRGLFIINQLADQVEFNDQGNTIWMTLPRC